MSKTATNTPSCSIDFYAHDSITNPIPLYQTMLSLGPVVWMEKNSIHAIASYDAVTQALRNHQVFSSGRGVSIDDDVNKLLIGSTLNSDPPQHTSTRAITFAPLSPKAVQCVRSRIEHEAKIIVDQVLAKKEFDAAKELAPHLPLSVVRDLVGLGDYGKDHMLDWGAATFELMGDPKERRADAITRLKQLREFLEDPATLQTLSDEGWAKRATELGLRSGMEAKNAAELMRDYIAPSLDTTISAISYGVMLFAKHPKMWRKLCDNRLLMRNAIDEIVRLNTPIRGFTRYVTQDITVAGSRLRKNTRVLLAFGAANRDPQRFADPNQFDIERKLAGHVGFGHGVHACLGMNLARLEMNCLFNSMADRVKRFELVRPVTPAINSTIHSLSSVLVKPVL